MADTCSEKIEQFAKGWQAARAGEPFYFAESEEWKEGFRFFFQVAGKALPWEADARTTLQ